MADSVIEALLKALAASPDDVSIRLHVSELLIEAGRSEEAFELARAGLASTPADAALLDLAARAGATAGRNDEAEGYRTLHDALTGQARDPAPEQRAMPQSAAAGPIPDTADELLSSWEGIEPASDPEVGEITAPELRLADVGGMQEVKERLELSFLGPLRNPELQSAFGKSVRGGLMLWGPPGCGKTFMARAVAGELGARFYEVGLADVLDMWIGSSERNLRAVFDVARNNKPCVLFFDEIDALGMRRTEFRGGGAAMRGVVNQLLTELDGVSADNDGVFALAATTHPWDVDPALRRPGRLDRSLLVLPPDLDARGAIISFHLRGRPASDVDVQKVASTTAGFSGADLALVVEQATEEALASSMKTGNVKPITTKALLKAARSLRPSITGWMDTARNHATFANNDGTYDELLAYLRRGR